MFYEHFTGKRAIGNDLTTGEPDDTPTRSEARSLVTEGRQTFGVRVARELWFKLGLCRTEGMYAAGANDRQTDFFHSGMINQSDSEAA